nr:MAG TPA: tail protein [Caudoviricetes sp.]
MGGMKVSNIDFIRLLPAFMQDDEAAIALSKAVNKLISEPGGRIPSIRTWDEVDNLSEAECDELAWELDVDWYDSTGMSLEEKRNTIKLAQQIKRKRGTKWAVERLISAYFGEGYVVEWYETDDSPYTFVALTTNTHTDAHNFEKFVEAVKAAKNSRSHLVGVFYFWQQGPDPGIEYRLDTSLHRYDFVKCGTRPRIATVGFIVKPGIELEPDETLHRYGFTHAGEFECGTYPRPGTLGAAVKAGIPADPDVRALRYNFGRKAGTYPRPGTTGGALTNKAATAPGLTFMAYSFVKCGTRRCGE